MKLNQPIFMSLNVREQKTKIRKKFLFTLACFLLAIGFINAQECDPCDAVSSSKSGIITPTMGNSASSSQCAAVTDYNNPCNNSNTSTWSSGDCSAGTNTGEMWFSFKATKTTNDFGLNFSTSYEGNLNYDNLQVTIYRGSTWTKSGKCYSYFSDSSKGCNGSSVDNSFTYTDASGTTGNYIMGDSTYFVRIIQTNNAATDTPDYLRMCTWLYDPNMTNPCTTPPTGCSDITPDKNWGTDGNCDGVNDVTANWCFSNTVAGASCVKADGGTNIKCTSGNTSSSLWVTFDYNAGTITNYGSINGFSAKGSFSGSGASPKLWGQVYDAGSGCPLGGCVQLSGSGYDMNLASLGLTNGTTYYMRVWGSDNDGVTPGRDILSADFKCDLNNLVNDFYDNALPICTQTPGSSTNIHQTTNGTTCNQNTTTDCTWEGGCGGKVNLLSASCGQNTNTNDSWYYFCVTGSNGTFNAKIANLVCAGSTGIQYWLFPDGTAGDGTITTMPDPNDFCADGKADQGSTGEFGNPVICYSPGTTANVTLTAKVSTGKCYYILTDGYRADYCDFDLTASCSGGCNLVSPQCFSDVTPPTISSVTATNVTSPTVFDVTLTEPIRCCQIDKSDFSLYDLFPASGPSLSTCCGGACSIASAVGIGCSTDGCSDTTSQIRITLNAPGITCVYDNTFTIQFSGSTNIYDLCVNQTTNTGSPNGGAGALIVLPVELTGFKGVYDETTEEIALEWGTASEKNTKSFTAEKSADGKAFSDLGTLPGAGNSNSPRKYNLNDKDPRYPVTYYRLRFTSTAGNNMHIGHVIVVKTKAKFKVISVHPVPANNILNVTFMAGSADKTLEAKIYDITGKELLSQLITAVEGENTAQLDIAGLEKGVYLINIFKDKESVYLKKIVKY